MHRKSFRVCPAIGLSIALSLIAMERSAFATLLIVTNFADSGPGTLRERIASANPGDEIHFAGSGPILLNSPLVISNNLQITGPSGSAFRVSGNNTTRVFEINGGTAQIRSLTICDGLAAGATGPAGMNGENATGAGIRIQSEARADLTQCVLSNNLAVGGQGGPEGQFGEAGNGGNGFGGAIRNQGILNLYRCTLVANTALGGLGGVATTGTPGNGGQGWGGAIHSDGNYTIVRCTLLANNAVAGSGDAGPGTGSGGAIYNLGDLEMVSSTIVSNTASGSTFDFGGGMINNGTLKVGDCTIVGNQADFGGGVAGGDYANTIIAGNIAGSGPDVTGTIVSSDFNFVQNTNGMSFTGITTHNIYGQDPLLGPLKDNRALDFEFTPPTMAPLPGSPVLDKGRNYMSADQRLFPRPYDSSVPNALGSNGADIGAVEIRPSTMIVTHTSDSGPGSLRQAIDDNNGLGGGNLILFSSNVTGTITLSGAELTITAPTSIFGPGAKLLTVSGNNSTRVFSVLDGPSEIYGLTISDGLVIGSPGLQGQDGFDGRGAGIYNQAMLSVEECTIRSNRVVGGLGGEGHLGSVGKGGKGMGAAVYNANGALYIEFCVIEGNSSTGGQGGIAASGEAGSGGNALGGAISTGGGTFDMYYCSLMNNVAAGGQGGVGGTPGMGGQGYGAGLYTESPARVRNSTFGSGNAIGGTGLASGPGNGSGYGGGIYNLNDLALSLCTVASNSASGSSFDFGGGIYNVGTLGLTNVTIAGNQADFGGGLHGNATAANSIFAANMATSSDADVSGTINSFDYNLIQSFSGLNIIGATAHVIIGQDPMLGPLADNGGVGPTMALRFGSPAIDKGKIFNFIEDQRGAPRPFDFDSIPNAGGGDGSDIGAFELGMPLLSISRQTSNALLRWPAAYGDFILESTLELPGSSNWTTVTNTPVIGGSPQQYYVTVSSDTENRFFRLKSR